MKKFISEDGLVLPLDRANVDTDYIIPKPMDPRLLSRIAPAVARAAVQSGVAGLPLSEGYSPTL